METYGIAESTLPVILVVDPRTGVLIMNMTVGRMAAFGVYFVFTREILGVH
jgi:hypothetical protein